MSDTSTQAPEEHELDQGGIAALREAARKGSAAAEENTDLKRRMAFLEAGIDLKHDVGDMLFKTWDGTTPIEEIVEKATKFGAMKGAAPAAPAGPTPEQLVEQEQERQRQELQAGMGGGAQPAGQQADGPHPMDAALEGYHATVQKGGDEGMARDDAMARILSAGHVQHDPRMQFDQAKHDAAALEADRSATRGTARWAQPPA